MSRFACAAALAVGVVSSSMVMASFVPAPILTEGQLLPGSPFTNASNGLLSSFVATNSVGGWAASVVTNDGTYVVGRANAATAVAPILRGNSVGITGGFGQGIGLDDAGNVLVSGGGKYVLGTTASNVSYHALGTAIPEPLAGLMNASGRNFGDILWTFGLGFDGTPVYRATGRNAAGTSNERWSMVRGLPAGTPSIIAQTEQPVPNLESTTPGVPLTLSAPGTARAFGIGAAAFAKTGSNTLVEGILRTGVSNVTTSNDQVMLLNGQALSLGGEFVRERTLLSAAIGGQPNEDWRIFRTAAISSSGSYLFTAQAFQVGGGFRELWVKDGSILYRTGSTLPFGDITLTVSDQAGTFPVAMNEAGDWAAILPTNAGRTLVVNGTPILLAGSSLVDTTGDGIGNAVLTFIKADLGQVALGERGPGGQFDLFFYGSTAAVGASPLSLFVVTVPEPTSIAGVAVAGLVALRRRR